jgi:deoxycytidylate deaminase
VTAPSLAVCSCLEKRILTTGFNGSPAGQGHCDEIGHLMVDGHCVRTIHAETNAIIQAALHGVSTKGATCYVTHLPCINCTKALINAGIVKDRLQHRLSHRRKRHELPQKREHRSGAKGIQRRQG